MTIHSASTHNFRFPERSRHMKVFVLGLCSFVVPAFATNAACPQITTVAQMLANFGCQTNDQNFTSVSTTVSTPAPVVTPIYTNTNPTNLAASLFSSPSLNASTLLSPSQVTQPPATVISPSTLFQPTVSTSSLSTLAFQSSSYSNLSSTVVAATYGNLAIPFQYLESLALGQNPTYSPTYTVLTTNSSAASPLTGDAPETSSIAMIGSGLVLLSVFASLSRKRRKISAE